MTTTGIRPTVTGVRAELLDCFQANLAVLADHHGGPGSHLALGASLTLAPRPGPDGLPTVEPDLAEYLTQARQRLGLTVRDRFDGMSGAQLARLPGVVYFVVADAFHLPWVPYVGHRHMAHSFLLLPGDGRHLVLDAYHNDTEWGPARPGEWYVGDQALTDAVPAGAIAIAFEPTEPLGEAPTVTPAAPEDYVRAFAEHADRQVALDRLTLQTWLLARSRRLHAVATGRADALATHLAAWDELARRTYLALRRVSAGRAEPPGVTDRLAELLRADQVHFGPAAGPSVDDLVAGVLDVSADTLRGTVFTDLPTFSSFRLVEIVERLERELGIEFDPEDLVPERIGTLAGLRAAVENARRRA